MPNLENTPEKSSSPNNELIIGNWLNGNLATENSEKRKSNIKNTKCVCGGEKINVPHLFQKENQKSNIKKQNNRLKIKMIH